MQVLEQRIDLPVVQAVGKRRHHVPSMQNGCADTVIIGWGSTGKVRLFEESLQAGSMQTGAAVG